MKRISAFARLSLVLAFGHAALAPAQHIPPQLPTRQVAAPYQFQMTPTKMAGGSASLEIEADRWIARGFDLKSLIAQIYDFDPRRVDFTNADLADTRYDITLTTSTEMETDALQALVVEALAKKLGLSIVHESRELDVYVLTAPGGPGAAMHQHVARNKSAELDDSEQFKFEERHCTGIASSRGITAHAGTMRDFGRELEPDLDRLLIDETHMTGGYDFNLAGYADQETLFKLLHDQLGLVVMPARRNVPMVVVGPAGNTQAGL
jgi:uncharacterized protein (TIGR03435 family)